MVMGKRIAMAIPNRTSTATAIQSSGNSLFEVGEVVLVTVSGVYVPSSRSVGRTGAIEGISVVDRLM